MSAISYVPGRENLDSRGNPTVEADVARIRRPRPRGSAFRRIDGREAVELRDGDQSASGARESSRP